MTTPTLVEELESALKDAEEMGALMMVSYEKWHSILATLRQVKQAEPKIVGFWRDDGFFGEFTIPTSGAIAEHGWKPVAVVDEALYAAPAAPQQNAAAQVPEPARAGTGVPEAYPFNPASLLDTCAAAPCLWPNCGCATDENDPRCYRNAPAAPQSPRFRKTYCSQCGGEFGPGDSGYSHCEDHRKAAPGREG